MSHLKLFIVAGLIITSLLLAACGAPQTEQQVNPDGSVNVEVTLTDFAVKSSVTEFKTGVKYHFVVTNAGPSAHEFMILPGAAHTGMSGMSMEEMDEKALLMIPIEQLPAGATAEVDYMFPNKPEEKTELVCMTPGHFEAGMRTPITVE